MSIHRIESTIARIFKEKLALLKSGEQLAMEFYLCFDDGYWLYTEDSLLDREQNYAVMRMIIGAFKPQFYAVVSDTNARDPHTNKIMYEQLMAFIVSPTGVNKTMLQPYDRLPSGKIKLTRPRKVMEGAAWGGIGTRLFDSFENSPLRPGAEESLVKFFDVAIASEKLPYAECANGQ